MVFVRLDGLLFGSCMVRCVVFLILCLPTGRFWILYGPNSPLEGGRGRGKREGGKGCTKECQLGTRIAVPFIRGILFSG